jgi:hypothetical protein
MPTAFISNVPKAHGTNTGGFGQDFSVRKFFRCGGHFQLSHMPNLTLASLMPVSLVAPARLSQRSLATLKSAVAAD